MDLIQAISTRYSCRAYERKLLDSETFDSLDAYIRELNDASGLRFQLYGPREGSTSAIDMSDAMFTGSVPCYAALVGPRDEIAGDKVGYFGEKLILHATQLGLNTCWVASTYDAETTRVDLQPGEVLWDVVPIGYAPAKTPMKQQIIRSGLRKRDKRPQQLVASDVPFDELPAWFQAAIDAVILGPSAVNGQPVVFGYHDGRVTANLPNIKREVEYNDLGIAKLHFEIAARACGVEGTWSWGCGGAFEYALGE